MCIFCQIANKEIPTEMLYEDATIMAFRDIKPSAPLHVLVVPKKHIVSLAQIDSGDKELLANIFYRVKALAQELRIAESGYKTVINTGKDGGQIIEHLHVHLLGGGKIISQI